MLYTLSFDKVTFGNECYDIDIHYGTRTIDGQDPYFTITADAWVNDPAKEISSAKNRERDIDAGRCLHDMILTIMPSLSQMITMHLRDALTGEPLYALSNGWYHYSNPSNHNNHLTPSQRAADYLGVSPDWFTDDMDESAFAETVDALRGMWYSQARITHELYKIPDPLFRD